MLELFMKHRVQRALLNSGNEIEKCKCILADNDMRNLETVSC